MAIVYIGTAGWSIPKNTQEAFVTEGSHLAKYSRVFNAVEINSSFYKDHKPETFEKWANEVGQDFRFSVKLNREFTQAKRLEDIGERLNESLQGPLALGEKLGSLLVQLPPSLEFNNLSAGKFFEKIKTLVPCDVFVEPRHLSWGTADAIGILESLHINKVRADPERCPTKRQLRERVEELVYYRLHGTPEIYRSSYSQDLIERLASRLQSLFLDDVTCWCIFDNTTFGYATENALDLLKEMIAWRVVQRPSTRTNRSDKLSI